MRGPDRGGAAWVERVEELGTPDGMYLMTSRGSLHLFDLRAGAYLRVPGERSNSFPHDASVLRLTQVERCRLGESFFIWLDDPREYAVWDYWRQSSPISAMYMVLRPDVEQSIELAREPHLEPDVEPEVETSWGEARAGQRGSVTRQRRRSDGSEGPRGPRTPRGPGESAAVTTARGVFDEILPGLQVSLDGLWTVVTSSTEWTVDDGVAAVAGPPVLEWPLRQADDWQTLLAVYGVVDRPGLRLRLDARHGTRWGPRSTCGVRSIQLRVGVVPTRSARRPSTGGGGRSG